MIELMCYLWIRPIVFTARMHLSLPTDWTPRLVFQKCANSLPRATAAAACRGSGRFLRSGARKGRRMEGHHGQHWALQLQPATLGIHHQSYSRLTAVCRVADSAANEGGDEQCPASTRTSGHRFGDKLQQDLHHLNNTCMQVQGDEEAQQANRISPTSTWDTANGSVHRSTPCKSNSRLWHSWSCSWKFLDSDGSWR